MDRGTTREVDCLELVGNPATVLTSDAVEREYPVRDREVDEGRPQAGEHQPAAELQAIRDRAGDQGHRDDREHQLECDEDSLRQSPGERNIYCRRAGGRICCDSVAADQSLEPPILSWVTE